MNALLNYRKKIEIRYPSDKIDELVIYEQDKAPLQPEKAQYP